MYITETQSKNLMWLLPRPKPDRYKGGMPLHAERWCLQLARDVLGKQDADILNLFCGMNVQGFRVDIRPEVNPDLVCDAHELSRHLDKKFDIVFADPPYSNKEAKEIYGTPKLRYRVWTSEATKLLRPRGLLVIYHKNLMPNPNKDLYTAVKRVSVLNRVHHPPRVAVYFQLKDAV